MSRIVHISILLLLTFGITQGQTRQAYLTAAEEAFEDHNFYASLKYYQEVLDFREDIAVLYKAGESARYFNAYTLAEEYYQKVVDLEQNGEYPLAMYHLAQVQKHLGKYEEAKENFMIFQAETTLDNPYYASSAARQMDDCQWAIDEIANPEVYATVERLHDSINSPYSEFAPIRRGDSLLYSSLRFPLASDESRPAKIWSKVMSAKGDEAGKALGDDFNDAFRHTAHAAYTEDNSRVYYTICDFVNGTDIRCDLYYRDISDAGQYGDPIRLPENINDTSYTITQPALGLDPYGSQPALYFASDRMGGKGKMDIWFSIIQSNGTFGDPVNLMSVNTTDNEITPFYHKGSNTLYFSSDGYQGFGGYDLYSLYLYNLDEPYIENLGMPINSSYNDIYFSLDESGDSAYFSSNRAGTLFLEEDSEACCNDIFKAAIIEQIVSLQVLTYDKKDLSDLLGATVTLIEVNGDEKVVGTQTIDNTNEFLFDLEKNRSYLIVAEKEGYLPDTAMVSTKGLQGSQDIVKKMYLEPALLDLELFVFDEANREALKGATVTIRDLADPSKEIVVQLNEDGNQFLFPLERDKAYEITVSRRGYRPETFTLDTRNTPGTKITRNVYLKEGLLEDYMPLAMYFDNDHPDPRTYRRTSKSTYEETYPPYMARKEEFKSEYSRPLVGNAKVVADDDIDRFFEYHVREGNNDLIRFIGALEAALVAGEKIEIVVQGFASPRATNAYNKVLSDRRISTVINQLRAAGSPPLSSYFRSGQLVIVEEALGEQTAPEYISDALEDQRNSIYSVPASRERRVEIIEIRRSN
ncbi:MAG: hypothetical protein KTR24_14035 [Saprospiraceae bacterium]|nr:hypothetical protein [Saprospiraceae bacterium]